MNKKPTSVIELSEFEKFAKHCLSENERTEIVNYIAANYKEGVIIKGTGGVRKLRLAIGNNKGKSGGIRVIYYYHNDDIPVFLITGFAKNTMQNISSAACNEYKLLTQSLINTYKKR